MKRTWNTENQIFFVMEREKCLYMLQITTLHFIGRFNDLSDLFKIRLQLYSSFGLVDKREAGKIMTEV